jgi:hypothetical protein
VYASSTRQSNDPAAPVSLRLDQISLEQLFERMHSFQKRYSELAGNVLWQQQCPVCSAQQRHDFFLVFAELGRVCRNRLAVQPGTHGD